MRKYTPPTCTLEVRGKESLLSRWAGRTILQDLKFKLSFDDPRQPDEKQVSIWGDRSGLEALSSAVSDYIQNFLQSRDGDVGVNGKEPITDSVPRTKTNSARTAIDLPSTKTEASPVVASETAPTKVIPISPIFQQRQTLNPYLKPKGLVTHELFLGALQTPESGASIDLSALQLFDLATALDAYGAEMLDLPVLGGRSRRSIPPWGYAAGAAAAVAAAIGLTPAVMRLANTSNQNSTVVAVSDSQETPTSTTSIPNSESASIPSPIGSPTPLLSPTGAVPPGQSLPFGAAPPGVTTTPGNTSVNPATGIPSNVPGIPNGLGTTGQPAPGVNNGSTPPSVSSTKVGAPNGRSPQYSFAPPGVAFNSNSQFKTANPSGSSSSVKRSTSSQGNTSNSSSNNFLSSLQNPPNSSRTGNTSKNQSQNNRRVTTNKKARTPVPVFSTGQVQPYVDPGDNPVNFGVIAQGENTSPNPSTTRMRRSSNQRQQPKVVRSQPSKEFKVAAGTSALPTFTTNDFTPSPSSNPVAETTPENPTPVVPQFVPNPTPPALGEIPPLNDNSSNPITTVSPVPSINSGNPSVAISPGISSPGNSPESTSATALIPPSNPITAITVPTPDTRQSSVNNDLAAVRSLDSIQASEVKRYFEGQWKPIKEVKQSLDYTLAIDPNGSVARIIPITDVSRQYIDRTGMPKLTNIPMVSPVGGSRSLKIRVSLEPDGTVKTFQEP
ncbi:DUF4335 domain-containing protein [Merismopedia glauca]|uniref:DUF4335 domain-containing protein n=1 Tax=Merismopedia glauca TaxID=292586 RepID=UPI0030DA65B2